GHHERLDGTGYPDGLAGDAIPLLAQLMHIVDVYDALTTKRPSREALSPTDACDELRREVGRGWHRPDLVEALIELSGAGALAAAIKKIPLGPLHKCVLTLLGPVVTALACL